MQAMAFRGLNQFDKALQAITSFLSHYPDSHIGWTLKGRIFLELGEMKKAITATQRAIDLYPLSSTAWNNLAIAFNKIGENEKSVSAYRQAIYIDPANSGAWMNIVEPLRALGQWDEVVRCTEKAFELTPTKKILHFNSSNLVSFLLQASEVDKALRISRLVSRHNPHDKNNWHNQALIYQSRDDFNNAIKCFHAVEDLESNDTFCLSSLALLYAKTGNTTKALAYCNRTNRWLEPIRAEWGSWQNIGRCYLLLGDNKRAVYYLKKTAELNPQEIPALMDLGVTLERANLNDEAIEIFVKVLEINPDYLSAYNSLALTQMKIGQFDYAQNNYESGIKTLARDLVKSLVNDRLNQILRTPDTQHNLWANYAMTAALYIASQDENIKSVAFPTGETALREARTQAHEGLYWIDQRDDKGNMTRMFLPNYFNTFFSLLSENRFYFRLIGSIGETLKHQGKYEEAKKHFAEADYFKKLNTDFLKLLL
jgi:tetratricopeptide (TPR) repeat protein